MMAPMPRRCAESDCQAKVHAKGLCRRHYNARRRSSVQPGAVRYRPRIPGRRLTWGTLWLSEDAESAVAREARRSGLAPTAVMAEVVEAWARRGCGLQGCVRPVYARGLCRPHYVQRQRGQGLREIR
jgi:hypothetical protein